MTAHESGTFKFDAIPGHEHGLYVVKGSLKVGDDVLDVNEMMVFEKDSGIELEYSAGTLFAIIGGEPFPEPRYIWWNLVSSSKEKIEIAKKAWTDGSFPQVPGDPEKIPVPEEVPKVANYP
jgi:redox-sensitive bicupin YhaK (pirin superfamily)